MGMNMYAGNPDLTLKRKRYSDQCLIAGSERILEIKVAETCSIASFEKTKRTTTTWDGIQFASSSTPVRGR
jgi:hypothetical protein